MIGTNLKTAHLFQPLGLDITSPLLSWIPKNDKSQTAFQIEAFCDGTPVWNSGKVLSNLTSALYNGPFASRDRIYWHVRLWDENDTVGDWSDLTWFEYGLLNESDWYAHWINPEIHPFDSNEHQPASYLCSSFDVTLGKQARIYATARGIYSLIINDIRVIDTVLAPGTSEYHTRLPYQVYDVQNYLHSGKNTIKVILGDGWWRGSNGNTGTRNVFGNDIAFLMQLEIDKKTILITDNSWKAAQDGPIYFNDLQLGEKIDARLDCQYHQVKEEFYGYKNLVSSNSLPVREKESFSPILITTPSGKKVLDLGQNMAGYVSFHINAHAGQTLRMTHGEFLDEDGEFSDENLKTIGRKTELHQRIEYTCKDGINDYSPCLCFFGFRYVLIESDIELNGSEFLAHAVYSDMDELCSFECDNPELNQLFHNTLWSQKSNFLDIPTDCPQRERSGWTGDAGVFVQTGLLLMDAYPVFERYLAECRVDQYPDGRIFNISPRRTPVPTFMDSLYDGSCGWGDAIIIIPYTMYQLYGDKKVLEDNYEMMKNWLSYCEKKAHKSRLKNRLKRNPYRNYMIDTGIHWGEWLEAGISTQEAMKKVILEGVPEIATAYFAYSSRMMAEIAHVLGKKSDEEKYDSLSQNAIKAYKYIELKKGKIHSNQQCRFVRPLYMDLLTVDEKKEAARDLNELVIANQYHLNTGFLTTPYLCKVLADNGYLETAYRLLLQEDAPGWLFSVKHGATTIWESWEGNLGGQGFASLNHYSKGAVVSWFIEGICGIQVQHQQIIIKPQPFPLLKFARAKYQSPLGEISCEWHYENENIHYHISIPANANAHFISPSGEEQELLIGENDFTI